MKISPPLGSGKSEIRQDNTEVFRAILGIPKDASLIGQLCGSVYSGAVIDEEIAKGLARAEYKRLKCNDERLVKAVKCLFDENDFKGAVEVFKSVPAWFDFLILAFVYRFRLRDGNTLNDLLPWIEETFETPQRALIALGVIGAYYGYSRLDKEAQPDLLSPMFRAIIEGKPPVKFGPVNNVERVLIDGCFQFAIHNKSNFVSMMEYLPWSISAACQHQLLPSRLEAESWNWLDTKMSNIHILSREKIRQLLGARLKSIMDGLPKMKDELLDQLWNWFM